MKTVEKGFKWVIGVILGLVFIAAFSFIGCAVICAIIEEAR